MPVLASLKTYASGGVFVGFSSYPSDGLFGGIAPGLNKIHPLCLIMMQAQPLSEIGLQKHPLGITSLRLQPFSSVLLLPRPLSDTDILLHPLTQTKINEYT